MAAAAVASVGRTVVNTFVAAVVDTFVAAVVGTWAVVDTWVAAEGKTYAAEAACDVRLAYIALDDLPWTYGCCCALN